MLALRRRTWVTTSPGRSMSRMRGRGEVWPPMCTMMGTPAPSAASRVRRMTSRSLPPGMPASMRTLRPTITSRLASTVATMASGVDVRQVGQLVGDGHARAGHVQECVHARSRGRRHIGPEAREGGGARRAGVDDRGDPFGDPHHVRLDGDARDAVVDVRVDVDQAGGDDHSARAHHLAALALGDALGHARHPPAGDADVARAVDALRRVDQSPTDHHRVELAFPPRP